MRARKNLACRSAHGAACCSQELMRQIKGTRVVDAKDVRDSFVKRGSSTLGMLDKSAAIEALAFRQALRWSATELRWVMIAKALTLCSSAAWQRLEKVSAGVAVETRGFMVHAETSFFPTSGMRKVCTVKESQAKLRPL